MVWSVLCDSGISWSYSLILFSVQQNEEHTQKETHKTRGVTMNNEKVSVYDQEIAQSHADTKTDLKMAFRTLLDSGLCVSANESAEVNAIPKIQMYLLLIVSTII